mmetsp:Transcript_85737/g.215968  ORF Transcript_85737/g.215968 Transcript_85737/m.215968 type:complete len:239 (+) Transcript_85737:39-755(+)
MQPSLRGGSRDEPSPRCEGSPREGSSSEGGRRRDVEEDSGVVSHDLRALQFLADKFYQRPFVGACAARAAAECIAESSADAPRGGSRSCHASIASTCGLCHESASCPVFGTSSQEFPSQILVNEYVDNWGIASHFEDFAAFGDTIATISLGNPVYMTLEQPKEPNNQCGEILRDTKVLLERRSLLILSGEARNAYRHGITRHTNVWTPDQGLLKREGGYRRVSLTIRHLLSGRRQAGQ